MIYFTVWFVSVLLWCTGGQFWKPARRYILPLFYSAILFLTGKKKENKVKSIAVVSLIGVNSMGYGVDSHIMKIFHNETVVRIVYAFLVSIPFIILLTPYQYTISAALIVAAFQLRLGAVKIGKYDLLFEDVARASAISAAICLAIYNYA